MVYSNSRALFVMLLLVTSLCVFRSGSAMELSEPQGEVILEVTGQILKTNSPGLAQLDLKQLEALGLTTVKTTTYWTEGVKTFEGVLARDLLDFLGAEGDLVTAVALNDYKAEIPVEDFYNYDVIFALRMDGEYMTVRNKGPIWIVYPKDDEPNVDKPLYHSRWVWQLKSLKVE